MRNLAKKKEAGAVSRFLAGTPSFLIISFIIVLLDQIIKSAITRGLELGESVPIIKNVFYLTLTHNTGMAFGMFKGSSVLSTWIALIVIGLVVYFYDEIKEPISKVGLALILGGTVGNLIDRIQFNHVIDYINFQIWPVFNLADIALTVGVFLLIIEYWRSEKE